MKRQQRQIKTSLWKMGLLPGEDVECSHEAHYTGQRIIFSFTCSNSRSEMFKFHWKKDEIPTGHFRGTFLSDDIVCPNLSNLHNK